MARPTQAATPALPEEREKQNLHPKSYADAIEEPPIPTANFEDFSNGKKSNGARHGEEPKVDSVNKSGPKHKAAVLRIVDTGAPDSSESAKSSVNKENKPQPERQKSQLEYSGKGADGAGRSPSRRKNRKSSSHQVDGAGEKGNDKPHAQLPVKVGDENDKPHTQPPAKTADNNDKSHAQPSAKVAENNDESHGSPSAKAVENNDKSHAQQSVKAEENHEVNTVFEKINGESNGSNLTSVKPTGDFENGLRIRRKEASNGDAPKRKDETLVSGRQAGQRWQTSGIRWAPMNIPLQRRLQTLLVLFHTLCIALSVSTFFFLCAIPLFWPLLIPYMIFCAVDKASTSGTLSRRSEFLRSLPLWSLFASYFPARLHRTQELPATRKYIFGYHPHGIISHGAFAAFATEALGFSQLFPGIKNTLLTLDTNFRIPIYRDYALAMGLASVSRESCENLLSKGGPNKEGMGRGITIVIGGAAESLDAQPYSLRLVLKRRKGFVKMALRTGADLVPVLAFGENDLYDQFSADTHPMVHSFQLLVKKMLGFTIPLFHARGVFNYDVGLMPYRRPLNIVVGRPIKVALNPKPEQEEIDRLHEEYVTELERLWDLWKDDFAPNREDELQILE